MTEENKNLEQETDVKESHPEQVENLLKKNKRPYKRKPKEDNGLLRKVDYLISMVEKLAKEVGLLKEIKDDGSTPIDEYLGNSPKVAMEPIEIGGESTSTNDFLGNTPTKNNVQVVRSESDSKPLETINFK